MTNYEEITNELGHISIIKTNDDGTIVIIPVSEANSDYQRYLRWLENPNEVEHLTDGLPQ
jgi:hypothetical protein